MSLTYLSVLKLPVTVAQVQQCCGAVVVVMTHPQCCGCCGGDPLQSPQQQLLLLCPGLSQANSYHQQHLHQ